MPQTSRSDKPDGQNAHNGSNVSAINGANMPKADEENGGGHCSDGSENDYDRLKDYPETIDYYSLLALARDPPPTEAQIRSAYKTLTLSFHPDKQPETLREAATAHYNKIRDAYETLLDPKKRVVYDMLGEEGVRHTWAEGGLMGRNGYAESQQIGVKAMDEAEFRRWFLEAMKRRERAILNDLVDASGVIHLSVDATSMFETTPDGDVSIRVPNLRPSAFLLGYALPIPLPDLSWFYSSKSAANGEGNEDRDEPPTGDGLSANQMPTKLQLQASVNGRFGKTVQTVKLLNPETGEKFDGQMRIPLTIRNANVNFGATFTHAISNDPSRRGILKGPLLSFLGDAVVTINTPLLPQPLAQASISKLITPIEGTRPFSLTVKSTCSSSPLLCPPDLGLTISRMVGAGVAFRSGYTSLPTILLPADPHDDDHETDEGDRDMLFPDHDHNHPKQPQQLPKPNETWGFNIGSSPAGVSLTMQYGRTIFARKPAEPLRSEWSSEGYYPSKSRSGSGAIRLGLRVVIESDLSMGWSLSGSRRVGEFTRMGLTVSTIGGMGLGCSVSWSRLGQTFKIPIALCPVDKITGDLCTLAVIMPAAVYGAVEFGYLRPRARRRERQEIAKMQKRLTKLVAKRKAESVQAVSMMRDQVLRRQDREADRDGLVVVHAEYGCPPTSTLKNKKQQNGTTAVDECYEEGMIDVTIPVAALVDQGHHIYLGSMIHSHSVQNCCGRHLGVVYVQKRRYTSRKE
ncbi:DnaJ domain-containing protein [Histoplasma capsulatum var. duboisii H88]|uniref:DnaJ domain-containing protein n=1 Tax=Ajellomyces capsulatus (strain H88) TaxID=544711 RepID=F0UPN3_AJEC8|nr:DnaJ domain-containing protein [Histoplasma capsulatum var. duboisii H88]